MQTILGSVASAVVLGTCLLVAGAVQADIIIGPGGDLGGVAADGGGTRTNVDLVGSALLPAGTYNATSFDINAAQVGNATPFLAIVAPGATSNGSSTDNFKVIASGGNEFITATGQ